MTDITRAYKAGPSLRAIGQQNDRLMLGTRALSYGLIAIHGTNAENVKTTNAVEFCIDGVMYSKAAASEIDISGLDVIDEQGAASAMTAQATAKDRIYLLALDKDGNIHVVQGQDVDTGADCFCPGCPALHAPFAAVKVANATGSDFTFGTTDLDTSGITDTYFNLSVVPSGAL